MIELRKVRHVIGVVEHGTFAKAAMELHITQSALTKSVQSVEMHLGIRLLERGQGGVTPTVEGEWFIEHGKRLLADAEQLNYNGREVRELRKGRLRIGAAPSGLDWVWTPSVTDFASRYPSIRLELLMESVEATRQLLLTGQLDFALGMLESLKPESELTVTDIMRRHFDLYVRRGHPLDRDPTPTMDDILKYPIAGPTRADPFWAAFRSLASPHAAAYEVPHYLVDSFRITMQLVERTDAVSFVVRGHALKSTFEKKFRTWPGGNLLPPITISLAWRRGWRPSPAAGKFLEICTATRSQSLEPLPATEPAYSAVELIESK